MFPLDRNDTRLWEFFDKNAIARRRFFLWEFVWIGCEHADEVRMMTTEERTPFHKRSLRGSSLMKHVHVIDTGEWLVAHCDLGGNPSRHKLLTVSHFIVDVVPAFILSFACFGRSPFSLSEHLGPRHAPTTLAREI
jgi:hypothetical protein